MEIQQIIRKEFHEQWGTREHRRTNVVCGLILGTTAEKQQNWMVMAKVAAEDVCLGRLVHTEPDLASPRRLRADDHGEGGRDLQIRSAEEPLNPEDHQNGDAPETMPRHEDCRT